MWSFDNLCHIFTPYSLLQNRLNVDINFAINEVDPYDAETIMTAGSFRGLNTSLERNLWKTGAGLSSGLVSGINQRATHTRLWGISYGRTKE